jgi:DNA-directed RNA polymerase specialized sigma24 family protein/ribosome-associated translation inhibitor RaiA
MTETYAFHELEIGVKGVGTKQSIRDHVRRRLGGLTRLLLIDERHVAALRVVVDGPGNGRSFWRVRVELELPGETLGAKAECVDSVRPALDEALDEIEELVRAYRQSTERSSSARPSAAGEQDSTEPGSALGSRQALRAVGSNGMSFHDFALAYHSTLTLWASSRIRRLEREGRLPKGRRTAVGVADEALLLAWERASWRRETSVEPKALLRAVDDVLAGALRRVRETTPPIERAPQEDADVDPGSFQHEQCRMLAPSDRVVWEDLLPGRSGTEVLDAATLAEVRETADAALAGLSAADRDAFDLCAFEGYECDEIAMMQHRDVAEVRAAVDNARRLIRIASSP